MQVIDQEAIARHGAERFRSEYHYAVFEYWRSAKMLRYLADSGITSLGRVLDDGCGGGGMSVSLAEEAASVTAIDLADRFRDAGTRLVLPPSTVATPPLSRSNQPLRLDIQCQRAASVKIGWKYLDD